MKKTLLTALVLTLALPVAAQTLYRCVDEKTGEHTISNKKVNKNCTALAKTPVNSIPAPAGMPAEEVKTFTDKKPATDPNFPKVNTADQKARDNDRRHILGQELESEERALKEAQVELEAAKEEAELQKINERLAQHQRNIENIQKELEKIPE